MDDATRTFERLRSRLMGIAYRILDSRSEAEAVLQDASLRWLKVSSSQQDRAEAWLIHTVTHLSISRFPQQREVGRGSINSRLFGQSIPDAAPVTPERMREHADDLLVPFLTLIDDLPPETRTAFLLREMFGVEYDALARMVGKSEAECRQMVQVARVWLRQERPRYAPSGDLHRAS